MPPNVRRCFKQGYSAHSARWGRAPIRGCALCRLRAVAHLAAPAACPVVSTPATPLQAFRAWRLPPAAGRQRQLRVCAGLTDIAGLVVFSALPFVAVQALADRCAGGRRESW